MQELEDEGDFDSPGMYEAVVRLAEQVVSAGEGLVKRLKGTPYLPDDEDFLLMNLATTYKHIKAMHKHLSDATGFERGRCCH